MPLQFSHFSGFFGFCASVHSCLRAPDQRSVRENLSATLFRPSVQRWRYETVVSIAE